MRVQFAALVTNCSAQKSAHSPAPLNAADLAVGTQDVVTQQWLASVSRARATSVVSDLYTGRGVRRIRRLAESLNAVWYVVSAGLGLLKSNERVPNYDLSVSPGTEATIQRRVSGPFLPQRWWTAVQTSPYAQPMLRLVRRDDQGLIVVALSSAYVPLLCGDLAELSGAQRERLRCFGAAGTKYPRDLQRNLMPYDSRLDQFVRGSKVDFAQRAAEHFIMGAATDPEFPTDLAGQRAWVESQLQPISPRARQKRQVVDDSHIRQIARTLASQGLSYTHALDALRTQHGIACEQSRFRRLYREAKA